MAPIAMTGLTRSRVRWWQTGLNAQEDIRDGGEHALVNSEYQRRDTGRSHGWLAFDTPESEVLEIADEWVGAVAKRKRETPEEPLRCKPC